MKNQRFIMLLTIIIVLFTSCFPYVYYDQEEVLIEGIDLAATMKIAEIELAEGGWDSILSIWVIRDQIISVEIATQINELYLQYNEQVFVQDNKFARNFGAWHFAWAISNLYRNGNTEVKAVLEPAYKIALLWPDKLEIFQKIAREHIAGDKIYMGDIHEGGVYYAQTHIVVPGNKDYMQCLDHYLEAKANDFQGYRRMKSCRSQFEAAAKKFE